IGNELIDTYVITNEPPSIPPVILCQPQNRTINPGTDTFFEVLAQGYDTVRYQWQRNGTNLLNATNMLLLITNAQLSDQGNYNCIASNSIGSTSSLTVRLTVRVTPEIVQQPLSVSAAAGEDVTFSVGVTGTPPILYT